MKKQLQKYLPTMEKVGSKYKILTLFGEAIMRPHLWQMHKRQVALGLAVGLFWSMIPMPFQMLPSAFFVILLKTNLPVALAACWVSNPVTMPPIFYANYLVGTVMLQQESIQYSQIANADSLVEIFEVLGGVWLPLYLGSLVVAVFLSVCGYISALVIWSFATAKP